MLQESEINLPWQNNTKDKKHDASSSTGRKYDTSSSTGSDIINGVHHPIVPLPKKKKVILILHFSSL